MQKDENPKTGTKLDTLIPGTFDFLYYSFWWFWLHLRINILDVAALNVFGVIPTTILRDKDFTYETANV